MSHAVAVTFVHDVPVEIPLGLDSLEAFRRWAVSDEFPEQGRIDYLAGRIVVDMSPEDLHTHGKVKTELVMVIAWRIKQAGLGEIYTDRTRVSCPQGDLSAEPDIVFVSEQSLDSGRVRLVPKAGEQPDRYVELEGPPDLIVEIVGDSSRAKDVAELPPLYHRAGVREFWRIDARRAAVSFEIFRPGPADWEPAPTDADGYRFSAMLDRWYRLDRRRGAAGRLAYDLREKQ